MVRILVLKRLYNLSDELMAYQLLDRPSYKLFCGLLDAARLPDRTTIWHFENRIGVAGAEALFATVEQQFLQHGYLAQGGSDHWCNPGFCTQAAFYPGRRTTAQRKGYACWLDSCEMSPLKTCLSGAYHAFKLREYAQPYLSTMTHRFNRCFNLAMLPISIIRTAANTGPRPEHWLYSDVSSCKSGKIVCSISFLYIDCNL